jgi:hypothetical protein
VSETGEIVVERAHIKRIKIGNYYEAQHWSGATRPRECIASGSKEQRSSPFDLNHLPTGSGTDSYHYGLTLQYPIEFLYHFARRKKESIRMIMMSQCFNAQWASYTSKAFRNL